MMPGFYLDPNRVNRLASSAHRAIVWFIKTRLDLEKRIVRYLTRIHVGVLEVHEGTDRHHLCSGATNHVNHACYDFARPHDVVHQDALQSVRVQILTKVITTLFLLGPEYLIRV